jgi:uncharacterized protein YfeS
MKYLVTIILLFLFVINTKAQDSAYKFDKIDYLNICKEVNNQASNYYLPKLLDRFSKFDTTMKYQEYFYLYYGYSCSDNYTPYPSSKYEDTLKTLFKNNNDKSILNRKMLEYCPKIFKELPLEMKYYEYYAMANIYNGDTAKAEKIFRCVSGIYDAIMNTGDGKTEATAFHVIYVENEYELIRFLDMEPNYEQTLTKSTCDLLGIKPNKFNITSLYFNVNRLFERSPLRK